MSFSYYVGSTGAFLYYQASTAYSPPEGDQVDFLFEPDYSEPEGDAVDFIFV